MNDPHHFTDDSTPIHVTVSAEKGGLQDTTRSAGKLISDKVKEIGDDALFEAFRAIYKVARKTELLIDDLQRTETDNSTTLIGTEVNFGIQFDHKLNAVITSGLEATISVKLTWGNCT